MRLPRFLHRWYAKANGYFWLPCDLCGRPFGGHEWAATPGGPAYLITGPGSGTGVCPGCAPLARATNWRIVGMEPIPGMEVGSVLGGVVFVESR
jgi:hypothetical protein